MADLDLDAIKIRAERLTYLGGETQELADDTLALIERVKRAEAVITKIRAAEKESTDWRDYGQTVDRILATYQNGADQP